MERKHSVLGKVIHVDIGLYKSFDSFVAIEIHRLRKLLHGKSLIVIT